MRRAFNPHDKLHHCYSLDCDWYFDGRTASRAAKPGHVPSLLEQNNVYQGRETMDIYAEASDDYRNGRYNGNYPLWSMYWDHIKQLKGIDGFKKGYREPVSVKIGNILYYGG